MSCYQLQISGTGTASPPTVKIPGAYSASDPGILVNIHQNLTTYKSTLLSSPLHPAVFPNSS